MERPQHLPDLEHFTGTETWFKMPGTPFTYTEGVRHVFQSANAYWLRDQLTPLCIKHRDVDFVMIKLTVNDDNTAVITCQDGNRNDIGSPVRIGFTDFPAKEQIFWFTNNVLLLASEY